MNRAEKSWLLPTAVVGYVVLSTATGPQASSWLGLLIPVALAFSLRFVARKSEASQIETALSGLRLGLFGAALFSASLFGAEDNSALRASGTAGEGLVLAGALLCIARQSAPPGLLQGHPAARSLDAFSLTIVIWSLTTVVLLLRAIAPGLFPIDPIAIDMLVLFASLGSMLLLVASLLRVKLLRGLEMGVGDRTQAALALAVAGSVVGAGSGFVRMATADQLAAISLVVTCAFVIAAIAAPNASLVTRGVRGFVALLLLGTPTALFGAWLVRNTPEHAVELALGLATLGMLIGLVARSAARPIAPEGARWLRTVTRAMTAALHPQPDQALRATLMELRKAEPSSKTRPEVFRLDPPGMLSVDIAGYLTERKAEFPKGLLAYAEGEPHRTLRLESLLAAQVRTPDIRPIANWFEAHGAKTATVLFDEEGPVGLLILPRGIRKSPIAMEEVELLGALSQRLAGLISVSASLKRSRDRELVYQRQAKSADDAAEGLRQRLEEQQLSDQNEAEARVDVLRAAAHSPAAQIALQALESNALEPTLRIETPIGVDPLPWAAHVHLYVKKARLLAPPNTTKIRDETPDPVEEKPSRSPLVIIDLSERLARSSEFWDIEAETSPWRRARGGTLVLLHPSALPHESQIRLADALGCERPELVIVCHSASENMIPRLERELSGPAVKLPTLKERGEDLQALIINELARLGLVQTGEPYSIDRSALYELIQRPFPGNDAELNGLIASAVGHCTSGRVELDDVRLSLGFEETPKPPRTDLRSRGRLAPRVRRR